MPSAQIPIIKGDAIANSLETDYRDSLPVNMYSVIRNIHGANGYMLCYPGLSLFATGKGIDRGGNYNDRFGEHYRLSGDKLISVSPTGIVSVLGTIPGTGQASMPYSFNTQAIIAGGRAFLYSPSGGFAEITDSDLGKPIDCDWINGYYFFTDGEYIYHTDIGDETSIDPLQYATAEFMPDKSLGVMKTQDNKMIVFGRYSIEYFVDVAQDDFAFQRLEARSQKIGIVATHAKCELDRVYIVGGRKYESIGIHAIGVGSSEKISTREIDKIIAEYTEPELSDIRMECRTENDISFIIVHLPNETLCFNVNAAKSMGIGYAWSILKSDINGNEPYRGINGIFDPRISKWIYGDKRLSNIGYLNNNSCTYYGDAVEWTLTTPFVNVDGYSIDEIELETIPGHTTTEDAKVAFSMSYDGLTYGREYWIKYGDPNDYDQKFIVRSAGYVNDWVSIRFRGASKSRMSFAMMRIDYA